jgi:hypothetical protein
VVAPATAGVEAVDETLFGPDLMVRPAKTGSHSASKPHENSLRNETRLIAVFLVQHPRRAMQWLGKSNDGQATLLLQLDHLTPIEASLRNTQAQAAGRPASRGMLSLILAAYKIRQDPTSTESSLKKDSTQIRHFVESASKVNSADRGLEYFQEGESDA